MSVTIRVAAIYSVGLWDMGQYVRRCESQFPHAKVHIDYLHPDLVYQRVRDGTADLGLVSFPRVTAGLTVLPWRQEEMVLACPPGHRLARLPRVRPEQLEGEKYVAFDRELVIRREVDRFLRDHGVTVEVALEFDNIENIKKGIEVGAGVALLPEPMIQRERQAGTILSLPLEGGRLMRPLGIIHRRQHHLGSAALGFIELLRHDAGSNGSNGSENGSRTTRSARGKASARGREKET
jgi:DNA-binding transcriptional LysR family regulator